MRLKTSNLLQLCVLTTKSAKESCKEEKNHGLQCTQKPDLQCSEEESKISARIIIIHIIEELFYQEMIYLKEFVLSVKEAFIYLFIYLFILRSRFISLKKPATRNKRHVPYSRLPSKYPAIS